MRAEYPQDEAWSRENFAHQPIRKIEAAYDAMIQRQAQAGQGLAQMACVNAAAAGVKDAKPEWFNSAAYVMARREAKERYRKPVAQTLLMLKDDNKIPSWVEFELDFDVVQMAAD